MIARKTKKTLAAALMVAAVVLTQAVGCSVDPITAAINDAQQTASGLIDAVANALK